MFNETLILKELDKLKQLIELPKYYVSEKISDLKREIDLEFQSQISKQVERNKSEKLTSDWLELIAYVDSFQDDCLKCLKQETRHATLEIIQKIENSCTKDGHMIDLIQNEIAKLENELFMNKTLLFVKSVGPNNSSDESCGRLLVLKNDFINWKTIQDFKNKQAKFTTGLVIFVI